MKRRTYFVAAALGAACSAALAVEYGTVISSTPVMAPLAIPQQECRDEPQAFAPVTSGGGAALGAVLGGVVGSAVGGGVGQVVATGVGVVAGAMAGDRMEAANTPMAVSTVRNCRMATTYENRVIGYDVVYEYNGQRYEARAPSDPGARIALRVTVAPLAGLVQPVPAYAPSPAVAPSVVYVPTPAYGYYGYGGPPFAVLPRFYFGGYWHGGGGGRWRHH